MRRQEITVVIIFAAWTCYIVGFVVFVVFIFRGDKPIEDNLDKAKFFGQNILETTLCLALLILLLLLSTGTNSIVYLAVVSPNGVGSFRWSGNAECHYWREWIQPSCSQRLWKSNACVCLYQLSAVSITAGRNKDKRFQTVENSQIDT